MKNLYRPQGTGVRSKREKVDHQAAQELMDGTAFGSSNNSDKFNDSEDF